MTSRRDPERLLRESYPEPGIDLPVFYGDLDTNGHLNNVAFGRFFEQGRFTAHRASGMRQVLKAQGTDFLVARVAIDYLAEARFGHPLHVRTRTGQIGRTSVQELQAAWQGETCVALAEVVLVHMQDGRPVPVTPALRGALAVDRSGEPATPAGRQPAPR